VKRIVILIGLLIGLPATVFAVEPLTVPELARALSADIGNLQVELRAAQIQGGKLQAEVDKLKEAAKPKEPEKAK